VALVAYYARTKWRTIASPVSSRDVDRSADAAPIGLCGVRGFLGVRTYGHGGCRGGQGV
jgi:hypothetical protein